MNENTPLLPTNISRCPPQPEYGQFHFRRDNAMREINKFSDYLKKKLDDQSSDEDQDASCLMSHFQVDYERFESKLLKFLSSLPCADVYRCTHERINRISNTYAAELGLDLQKNDRAPLQPEQAIELLGLICIQLGCIRLRVGIDPFSEYMVQYAREISNSLENHAENEPDCDYDRLSNAWWDMNFQQPGCGCHICEDFVNSGTNLMCLLGHARDARERHLEGQKNLSGPLLSLVLLVLFFIFAIFAICLAQERLRVLFNQ